jgi:hypothetical protein
MTELTNPSLACKYYSRAVVTDVDELSSSKARMEPLKGWLLTIPAYIRLEWK